MSPSVNILEAVTLVSPLTLQFWDRVTSTPVRSGLQVSAAPAELLSQVTYAVRGQNTGAFSFPHLPGLRTFENGAPLSSTLNFLITVTDTEYRFLPAQFTMPLPSVGLGFPACLPVSSPPGAAVSGIPLFTSAPRIPPAGMAVLRADVRDASSNTPAPWALFEAGVNGGVYYGLTDQAGKLLMIFPYPEPVVFSPGAVVSPPLVAPGNQTWTVRLKAFYQPVRQAPAVPDLCDVLDQPPAPLWSDTSLGQPLAPLTLVFGRELIVRSWNVANGSPMSTLLLTPVASPLDHL